jgi:amidase/aspartyl-tRNA(Asn)/glutamyl-tRNA(Gln) amidotransferase subunit A
MGAPDDSFAYRSATEVAAAIRARQVSPVEVMDATIARIEQRNPSLTAFVFTAFDEARDQARAAERAVSAGEELGPLHGVPTAIKDLFDFKPGWPATFGGIPALRSHTVPVSCVWAERMEAAGAIVVGKTNSPVMGFRGTCDNPLFGPTRNPFDVARNGGGSSGGGAAAVADGMLAFAEGTDGGGSVRIPASWCGVLGFKQSWGRVPSVLRPNAFAGTNPFLFEGLLTRTVADAAVGLSALCGPDPRDPFARSDRPDFTTAPQRGVEGLRVAYSPDFGGFPVDPRVTQVVELGVAALAEAGARVETVELRLPRDQFELSELWCRLIAPLNIESLDGLAAGGIDLLGDHRDELPEPYLRWIGEAERTSVRQYAAYQVIRSQVFDMVQAAFTEHDLLVTPTLACLPVRNAEARGETFGPSQVNGVAVDPSIGWCLTYPLNFTGHPAASVPAGLAEGLPVGMQVIGRLGADADVLAAAAAVELVRPWNAHYATPAHRELADHQPR